MGRTAELKLTSEERCRKAFEAWIGGSYLEQIARNPQTDRHHAWMGWNACWRYLQEHVKEYIEG
jgi:hypothetical protein